jgi:signal transduction histidine kinase
MMLEISHGLQTPLAIIKGRLEDLKLKHPNQEEFNIFEKSLDRISHLIYDMLNLARLKAIDDSFKKEKLNLSNLLLDQIEYFEVSLKDKNIEIDYEISPGIYIMGRKEKLEELFSNLVSNAAKYMEKVSEKNIMIKAIQENGEVLLSVIDTGPGIESESLAHMFEKFYRAKNNMPGTGLGLAICKKIVEKHGGKIWLKSKLGKGSEFHLSFPELI